MTTRALLLIAASALIAGSFVCNRKELSQRPLYETRGVWITRWDYTSQLKTTEPDSQKAAIVRLFRTARRANLNAVFFQVRGNFDAYYRSDIEPWGASLSGNLGDDPGWDPLEFALLTAREEGLQFHAWMNVFPLWRGKEPPPETEPRHALLEHPEWLAVDSAGKEMTLNGHYVFASPGIPAVRSHIARVVADVASRYDVDGIHFDYIRYPEKSNTLGFSHDSVSVALYDSAGQATDSLDWEDWQRSNLSLFLREVGDSLSRYRPDIILSAAVIGKYRLEGWSGYNVVYQDAVRWLNEGLLDFIIPMAYSKRKHPTASFTKVMFDWKKWVDRDKGVLAGVAAYRAGGKNGWKWSEIDDQIADVRQGGFGGMIFFNASALKNDWESIADKAFKYPALPQPLAWGGDSIAAPKVKIQARKLDNGGVGLSWTASPGDTISQVKIRAYALFRWKEPVLPFKRAENLIAVLSYKASTYIDYPPGVSTDWQYAICSTGADGVLSPLSMSVSTRSALLSALLP